MMEEEFRKLTKWRMVWEVIQFFGLTGLAICLIYFLIRYAPFI